MKEKNLKEDVNSLPAGKGYGWSSLFLHYLKIAFRNMWKYKSQTLISVLGLAVGFTCFALATLWIVHEMTYDSFHKNAKHMYVVYKPDFLYPSGYSRIAMNPLGTYLKESFPEIAEATSLIQSSRRNPVRIKDVEVSAMIITVDSSFFRMFDVKIFEGSNEFLIPNSRKIAITREKARQLFGNDNPIGKTIVYSTYEHTICAVVSGMSKQSNYPFDFIRTASSFNNKQLLFN